MSDVGKTNIVVMWTVGPDDVAEGDRIFASHVDWMTGHSRSGDTALLSYKISKGAELTNPVDPNSEPTGSATRCQGSPLRCPAGGRSPQARGACLGRRQRAAPCRAAGSRAQRDPTAGALVIATDLLINVRAFRPPRGRS